MNERARFFVVLLIIIINTTVFAQEELCPSAVPSRMAIGMGGITLPPTPTNLRSGPSTETQKVMEMPVGTIFTVIEGPECSSTYTWWNIELIDGAQGWVAEGLDGEYWIAPYQQESDLSPASDLSILILGHWVGEDGQEYTDPSGSYTFFEDGTMEYRGPNNSLRGTYWWRDSNTIEFEGVWTDHNGDQYPVGPGVYTVDISGDRLILSSTDGTTSMSFRRSEIVSVGSGNLQPESVEDCSDTMPPRLSLGTARVTEGISLWQAPSEESEIVAMVAHWGRETETEVQVLQGPICSEGLYWYEVGIGSQIGWAIESIDGHYFLVQVTVESTVSEEPQMQNELPEGFESFLEGMETVIQLNNEVQNLIWGEDSATLLDAVDAFQVYLESEVCLVASVGIPEVYISCMLEFIGDDPTHPVYVWANGILDRLEERQQQ